MTRPAMYHRPNKPLSIPVKRRVVPSQMKPLDLAEPLTVDKATECHVTPDDVARRMVGYLGPVGDFNTLEPSAGTGQLVRALLASGHSPYEITAVERHIGICRELYKDAPRAFNMCFLEYATEAQGRVHFPRIIMNPPFKQVRQHIKAALSLMGQDGHQEPATLVALVPITFDHPDAETLETLPPDTFATAKVHTKIIRIEVTA